MTKIKQSKQKREHVFQAKISDTGVRFVRYFSNNPGLADYKATFLCDLDYDAMVMHVYSSVCTPVDNFNKDLGVKLALQRAERHDGFSIKLNRDTPIIDQILHALIELFIMKDESRFVKLPSYSMKRVLINLI